MDLDKTSDDKSSQKTFLKKFEWISKYLNFGLIILIIILVFVYFSKNSQNFSKSSDSNIKEANVSPSPVNSSIKIILDITGAVSKPGVYEMIEGDRIVDLIEKAGGFTDKVDLDFVEKNINKAAKLSDGQKIYIPRVGESISASSSASSSSTNTTSTNNKSSGPVNINTSSKQQLVDLPEIGEVTADKIIAARPYANIDELISKGAMKKSSVDKIRELITV